jgi:RHS repeat-associated protein
MYDCIAQRALLARKFTGKERDAESGLDDFDARYYASTLGRFMRPDEPLVDQQTGNPQSWNLYSYVRNNPLNNTDPSGNACVSNGKGGFKDDDSGGQTCAEANDPKNNNTPSAVVTAKAPPSADDQRILDFANDLNRYNIQNNTLKLFGASAAIGLTGGAACYYLCPGATVTTIGVTAARVAPLLPVVAGAIEKLQKLGISLQEANEIITSPESQKLVDNLNGGNINVIKEVGGQLVRITTNPEGTRIISAGLVRANQIANGIANGRFVPKQ